MAEVEDYGGEDKSARRPGRPSKEQKLKIIHEEAMIEFGRIQTSLRDERLQCLQDRRFCFIAGAQWEGPLGLQFENKPKIEVNKVQAGVNRIIDDYRNNRIDALFVSKDGSTDDSLADTCAMLYRADELDSAAEEAKDKAFEEAVSGGFGAWRLCTDYADEDEEGESERRRITFEPIHDADSSVFFDLDAKRQDKSDARCCYVVSSMTRSRYKELYPDDEPTHWPKIIHQHEFDWLTPDVVYIAEYYEVEDMQTTLHTFRGPDNETLSEETYSDEELEDDPELVDQLRLTGFTEVRKRKVKRKRVHKYLMNGNAIMEDQGYIAGREIPVIPVYGKWSFVDNVERCSGHVRLAKDAQRLKNMQLSKLAEISAASHVEKPIVTPEQIAGHQIMWAEDNKRNFPYLVLNPVMDAAGNQAVNGPIGSVKASEVPPAMAALLQITESDMQDIFGNPAQAERLVSHVSGKTVQAVQQQVNRQSFLYISNMSKAIRRSAQVWLSIAKDIYTEPGRKMKGVGNRGQRTQVELHKTEMGPNGQPRAGNDLTRASFDVETNVGPSAITQREAVVQWATGLMPMIQDPETQSVLLNIIMMNSDGEGINDIQNWSRQKLVRAGVLKPTPEEQKQMQAEAQNAKPSAQDQALMAAAAESQAKAQRSQADVALIAARVDQTKADTFKTFADVKLDHHRVALDAAKSLHEMATTPLPPPQTSPGNGAQ